MDRVINDRAVPWRLVRIHHCARPPRPLPKYHPPPLGLGGSRSQMRRSTDASVAGEHPLVKELGESTRSPRWCVGSWKRPGGVYWRRRLACPHKRVRRLFRGTASPAGCAAAARARPGTRGAPVAGAVELAHVPEPQRRIHGQDLVVVGAAVVTAARDEAPPARAHAGDGARVADERVLTLARAQVPQLDGVVARAGEEDVGSVGRRVGEREAMDGRVGR